MASTNDFVTVNFPYGQRLQEAVSRFRLCQDIGKHTLAFLTLRTSAQSTLQMAIDPIAEGTPVEIAFGRLPNTHTTWYGYVNHYEHSAPDRYARAQTTYVLIGTSAGLNNEQSRSWNGVTDSYIVRRVAKEHGYASVIQATPLIRPYTVQSGESDLALLNRLAELNGYRLWVDGATLSLLDPRVLMEGPRTAASPVFIRNRRSDDTVLSFTQTTGSTVPDVGVVAQRTVYGLAGTTLVAARTTPDTSRLTKVQQTPPVRSYGEAVVELGAANKRNDNWIAATVRVRGDWRVQPNQMIYLQGSALSARDQGGWLVTSAEHDIALQEPADSSGNRYVTTAKIVRNTVGGQNVSHIIRAEQQGPVISSVLQDGIWRAAMMREVTYGI